jgi:hypothetical protein
MQIIGDLIAATLEDGADIADIRQTVKELTDKYPCYPEIN